MMHYMLHNLDASNEEKKRLWNINTQVRKLALDKEWNQLKYLLVSNGINIEEDASPSLINMIPQLYISILKDDNS